MTTVRSTRRGPTEVTRITVVLASQRRVQRSRLPGSLRWRRSPSWLASAGQGVQAILQGLRLLIRAHRDSPFAKRRLRQVITLPLAAMAGILRVRHTLRRRSWPGYCGARARLRCCASRTPGCPLAQSGEPGLPGRRTPARSYLHCRTGDESDPVRSHSSSWSRYVCLATASDRTVEKPPSHPRRRLPYPVVAICAVQAASRSPSSGATRPT